MSPHTTQTLSLRATPAEVFAALREAARRTGFRLLTSDAGAGTAVFTSAHVALNFGDRVDTRIVQGAAGTVDVTLTSDPRTATIGGATGRAEVGAFLMAETLSELLPPA